MTDRAIVALGLLVALAAQLALALGWPTNTPQRVLIAWFVLSLAFTAGLAFRRLVD